MERHGSNDASSEPLEPCHVHGSNTSARTSSMKDGVAPRSTPQATRDISPSETMQAALVLGNLYGASPTAVDEISLNQPLACEVTEMPDRTDKWPFAEGKGCFAKDRNGKDVQFLERLFLLLSFPNLALPAPSVGRVGDALRWKTPASLKAAGLPPNVSAFEIVDVPLLEAAVYPQFASGSFHKLCAKWRLFSPRLVHKAQDASANEQPAKAQWPCVPSKKLLREWILFPLVSEGTTPAIRPLPASATLLDVRRICKNELPLMIQASRLSRSQPSASAVRGACTLSGVPPPQAKGTATARTGDTVAAAISLVSDGACAAIASFACPDMIDGPCVFPRATADEARPSQTIGRPATAGAADLPEAGRLSQACDRVPLGGDSPGRPLEVNRAFAPGHATSKPTQSADAAIDPHLISRIIYAVNSAAHVPPLSDAQLRAILALAASTSAAASDSSPARAAPPTPTAPSAVLAPSTASPATTSATFPVSPDPCTPLPLPCGLPICAGPPQAATDAAAAAPHPVQCAAGDATPQATALCYPKAEQQPPPSRKRTAQWGELRVALWDTLKRTRVSANSYKGDLHSYLEAHPHLEVYNRQDRAASAPQAQARAAAHEGAHRVQDGSPALLAPSAPPKVCDARVVLWSSREGRKLTAAECPTPASLCAFLRANPHVEVYCGQRPPPQPVAAGTATSTASSVPLKPSADSQSVLVRPHAHESGGMKQLSI